MASPSRAYFFEDIPATAAALLDECDLSLYRASGPGGQHRNKVETAVRLIHRPTGTIVTSSDSRSQARNRVAAVERLRSRLIKRLRPRPPRVPTRVTARARAERLESKQKRARVKSARRRVDPEGA